MELFPFQEYLVNTLKEVRSSLIGDDMGLGKTVEAIILDLMRRQELREDEQPKTLIVTPLAVVSSWRKHYETWAPSMRISTIDNKNRVPFIRDVLYGTADVYICHWPALRLMPEIAEIHWFHIIGDEIHAIQNRKAQQTRAFKKLKADYKTGLSGTPAFDKPDDLWSILNWLYPKYWTSYWKYFNQYVLSVEYNGYRQIIGVNNVEELQRLMSGFYIRRTKEEVLTDLPEKYYSEREVELTPLQQRAYDSMRKTMIAWVGEHEQEPIDASVVIAQITRLQQLANAYAEIDEDGQVKLSEPSSKLDEVMEIIDATASPVVVFSQFSQMIKLLEKRLIKAGIAHGIYIGSTPEATRTKIVEDFQAGKLKVFAGTISAGGVGITLTASSTVVFIDRGWSPSINVQAEDRLHRIGAKSAVQVIDIRANKTLDAKRMKQIMMKWNFIKLLIGDTEGDSLAEELFEDEDGFWE